VDNDPKTTQVPIEGGSGCVPTGALQFKDDWPGLFVRGDVAIPLAQGIRQLKQRLQDNEDVIISLALHRLESIANIIERDVIVR
jgi:hypothetical protein